MPDLHNIIHTFTDEPELNRILNEIVCLIQNYANEQIDHIRKLSEIGIALSSEQNMSNLFELIVDEARSFSNADGGTLYLVNEEAQTLEFVIVQNDTMKTRMGGKSGQITWKPVPLMIDGKPNFSNVSSYVANTGKTVNIADVYTAEGFDFAGTKRFDAGTGYRSKSMLVVPMKNKDDEIIGVLQLINALDRQTREPIPFLPTLVSLIESLASQAAVAITNVRLYKELETLFDSFIQVIATAIDEKSPYTAGHIQRVQRLTMDIAKAINDDEGNFKDFYLNEDELKELSVAAWMHDVGKITTPEHVVDKSTKLEGIFDKIELIKARYEIIKRDIIVDHYKTYLTANKDDKSLDDKIREIDDERDFVVSCNRPGEFMDDQKVERLNEISKRRWNDNEMVLSTDELYNLSVRKGSLNPEERKIIENHALVTYKMLRKLPFPKKLKRVPEIAAKHHEKLDGTGYPFGVKVDEIPW
ncbi:MAG: HD domain-containing phosphohydrolase [Thermodesulfovibrionales bacterium]